MTSKDAADSYSAVTIARRGDMKSQEVPFRHFNNYVKKFLIQYALDTRRSLSPQQSEVSVLDLGSGRGGDLGKWLFSQSPAYNSSTASLPRAEVTKTSHYECYDISPECIVEAQRRYDSFGDGPGCSATFSVADCFSNEFLCGPLRECPHFGKFDIVSIQFAFHYACASRASIDALMETISSALLPGGVVIITTVDHVELSRRVREKRMGNALFSITLEGEPVWEETSAGVLLAPGTQYHFKLDGFVDCPEYAVHMPSVMESAAKYNLQECTDVSKPFEKFLATYKGNWKNNKGNKLSDDEVELTTLYRSLCFKKSA